MESLNPVDKFSLEFCKPDPWTYYPWEYNPWNSRETLIEACVIYIGYMYGIFRMINIMRIFRDDEREERWNDFWGLCESF